MLQNFEFQNGDSAKNIKTQNCLIVLVSIWQQCSDPSTALLTVSLVTMQVHLQCYTITGYITVD